MTRRLTMLLLAVMAALCAVAGAVPGPPDAAVLAALNSSDVYVEPPLGGTSDPRELARLTAKARTLSGRGQPVKLVLMRALVGRDPFDVARGLRGGLGFSGTVVVTTRAGRVGAAGKRTLHSLQVALEAGKVAEMTDPVARLEAAADLTVPPPRDPGGRSGMRGLVTLIGLTLLGGAWAIGWGLRREQRLARAVVAERRAVLRLLLDALAVRITVLRGAANLTQEAVGLLDEAAEWHAEASASTTLGRAEDMAEAGRRLNSAGAALVRAGELVGHPQPQEDLFRGLCGIDPAHGVATTLARLPGRVQGVGVCADCRAKVDAGVHPERRWVPVSGRPTPFDEAGIRLPAPETAPARDPSARAARPA